MHYVNSVDSMGMGIAVCDILSRGATFCPGGAWGALLLSGGPVTPRNTRPLSPCRRQPYDD